jgi:hypothetical protein
MSGVTTIARRSAAALLAIMLISHQTASAQTARKCVTPDEAQNVVMFALPDVMLNTVERCRPHLTPTSYLLKSGGSLANTYRAVADTAWGKAKPVLFRLINEPVMRAMPDNVVKPFFGGAVGSLAADRVQPSDCDAINRAVEALAPLPPQNMAMLIGLVIEKQGAKAAASGKKDILEICSGVPVPINKPTISAK